LTAPHETTGERRVQGVLVAADEREITVRTSDGVEVKVNYVAIDRARTVFEWKTTSKEEARHSKKKVANTTEAKAS